MSRRSRNVEGEAPDGKIASRPPEASFAAKAKDGVYKATEIVIEDATAVEHMAQRVEKISRSIRDDVDNVETALHQMIANTSSKEEIKDEIEVNSNDLPIASTTKPLDQMGNLTKKNSLGDVQWLHQTTLHAVFIFLTLCIVLLHEWGGSILGKNDMEHIDNNTVAINNNSTPFSILLIYIGTIWKVLKYLRNAMTGQNSAFIKVEERVHEIGQEVKTVANNIEEIAHNVEDISQHIEKEAIQIQSLVKNS